MSTDSVRNVVHVIAQYGAFVGIVTVLVNAHLDYPEWRRRWRESRMQRALRVLEPVDLDTLKRIKARHDADLGRRPMGAR